MIFVADSSALIALSLCSALHFLDALFGEIKVPLSVLRCAKILFFCEGFFCNEYRLVTSWVAGATRSVFDEVTVKGKKESIELSEYLKDKIESISVEEYVITDFSIGKGDIESMALYKKLSADKLLIDDKRARKIAQLNGINIIGSIGVLLIAKEKGLVEKIKAYVEIIRESEIHINDELIDYALELAGES